MERRLIVIENRKTEERFLWNPFNKVKGKWGEAVPKGFIKVTSSIPLDEKNFGDLPVITNQDLGIAE
ncbi:hypothetical protein [Priestia flexa]|uniref:hypothetical protein n=1 Tax=Priestia flexa TaxID=86664 RepID=UPI003D086A70